jgi:hypothetical protein
MPAEEGKVCKERNVQAPQGIVMNKNTACWRILMKDVLSARAVNIPLPQTGLLSSLCMMVTLAFPVRFCLIPLGNINHRGIYISNYTGLLSSGCIDNGGANTSNIPCLLT